ncbi:MAG: NGG1p interacting factor NIF3 [Thiolinea sp.]
MYQLIFYVPATHKESVKQALFAAGAGRIGNYDQCAWECLGTGQFRPLAGSNPFLGQENNLHLVDEYRVELVCAADYIQVALQALIQSHPYEEPAYSVFPINTL